MAHRVIVFAEPSVGFAAPLLDSVLKALGARGDVEAVAVCVTAPDPARLGLAVRTLVNFAVKALFNPRMARHFEWPRLASVTSVARKHGAEIIAPPRHDVNDPVFVGQLRTNHRPTLLLSLGCLQIWTAELLALSPLAVNFHNGFVPDYRGLWTTHWSLYRREATSGYSFHVMDAGIDSGPIIHRHSLPIPPDAGPASLARLKWQAAQRDVPTVLEAVLSGTFEPVPSEEKGAYFSAKDAEAVRVIDDPSALTAAELQHRLRSFGSLKIRLAGARLPVTSLRRAGSGRRFGDFVTADGVTLYPDRLRFLPAWLYRAARGLGTG